MQQSQWIYAPKLMDHFTKDRDGTLGGTILWMLLLYSPGTDSQLGRLASDFQLQYKSLLLQWDVNCDFHYDSLVLKPSATYNFPIIKWKRTESAECFY